MAHELTQTIQTQIDNKRLKINFTFTLDSVDQSDYLIDWTLSYDKAFGASSAVFILNNAGGIFGDDGDMRVEVGDIVEFSEQYEGDATEFKRFYGIVEQRSIIKTAQERKIVLNCLDYIATLQKTDIDLDVEGTKVEVTEETLTPEYLPSPNDSLAQVFDFANNAIAQDPAPLLTIRPKSGTTLVTEDPQYDGFDVYYANGQVVLGTPLNASDNYDLVATSYHFYTQGAHIEDILEDILTQVDGFGKYMFGETSAQDVIDNHLTDTFDNVEGTTTDTLTPNYTDSEITIKHQLSQAVIAGDTRIELGSAEGLPSSGTASINGDTFTWSSIESGSALTGIPASGSYSLGSHPINSYVAYTNTYDMGQVWYLTYSNIQSTLTDGNFDGLSGSSIEYKDYRNGRIILDAAISTGTTVTHNADYTFKTLQATGVTLNRIRFNSREVATRFDAINKLRDYLAPNYIIRTIGDDKIWASYLTQKTTADYTLSLTQSLNYLEDEDLYTRVKFFGKNKNPSNVLLNENVQFVSAGVDYKSTAVQTELTYEEDDGNFYVYKSGLGGGRIDVNIIKPIVYINNVPIDDHSHQITMMPIVITVTQKTKTITESDKHGTDVTVHQYWYYKMRFAHSSIDPNQDITIYDAVGVELMTISANDSDMNYANGVYNVPGSSKNSTIEQASSASYTVFYALSGLEIDYDNIRFRIAKQMIPSTTLNTITATFQYWTALTPWDNISQVIDGRFDTQVQTVFYAEPPTGLAYSILDLGQERTIQAIDIIGGFYKPDDVRRFDTDFRFSLKYSTDNVIYYTISPETQNVDVSGGDSVSFEEEDLGEGFSCRYLRMDLEDVKKIEYGDGIWVVAITEVSAYADIILSSEAKLIPTTDLLQDINVTALDSSGEYPSSFNVTDTSAFSSSGTAYIGSDSFTYTGTTSTSFTGVEGLSSNHSIGARVSQTLEDDTDIYDDDGILPQLGDRLYKEIKVDDSYTYVQEDLDRISKAYLQEFYKNHTKVKVNVLYAPYLRIGQTIALTDSYQGLSSERYFIETISDRNGAYELVLAKYPE
jgi:hypothetical protein